MPKLIRTVILLLLVIASSELFPQIRLHKTNQFDSDCKKHGYWVEYLKSDPDKKTFKGWYDHGNELKDAHITITEPGGRRLGILTIV